MAEKIQTKPHPWKSEIALLLRQSLAFIRFEEVSAQALSRARYHQKWAGKEDPFYLRQFGGINLGDQIVLRFSPADTMFKRRCSLSISARGLTEEAVQEALAGALAKHGFVQEDDADGHALWSNGVQSVDISIFFKSERASISIRQA